MKKLRQKLGELKKTDYLCIAKAKNSTSGEVGEWLKPPVC